ncbi:glycosyltransferase family 4 protein [Paenibacillus kobensis]|uniref:glycosyltransferase family 4 protein n=1 Tax=Paenibacillus kobensis TaxID=59841 RepID=UPI000FD9AB6D|nr:glycosyltransferase family 1 protein [Paenibacillus kobensis]
MRIGVDAHVLAGKFQGSRTYLLNLYQQVLEKQSNDEYLFFGHWDSERPYGDQVEYVNFKSSSRLKRLTYETNPLLRDHNIELYHSTYISPLRMNCDSIVTIHDILFETHPQFFTPQEVWRNKLLVRRSAKKAKQIHTVSEFSRQALIELYDVPEHKIFVVPNGVDLSRFTSGNKEAAQRNISDKYGVQDYILTVGRIEPRKNHIALLEAYKQLRERAGIQQKLVIVGKPDFGFKSFFERMEQLQLQDDVQIIDSVDDATLPDIYRAARLFVYPSFAEGFGIPPLEAMACGVPVVSSNRTAIPEVIGESGMLVDPTNINDLSSAMERMLSDEELRAASIIRGLEQSTRWTWESAAEKFINALDAI